MAKPIPYDEDDAPPEDERDMRKIAVYDDEALKLMQGWTGGQSDPLYAISSTGGWNYAWVFTDAIYNIDKDLRSVKKLGRNKFQLGKGTFSKAEIDELRYIRDALQMTLDDPESEMVDEKRGVVQARRKTNVQLTPAERFFYDHAGHSYPSGADAKQQEAAKVQNAKSLAHAEAEAEKRGWTVEWEHDQDADTSWMDPEQLADYEAGRTEMLSALLRDENGEVLESLGGVALNARGSQRDPYGRVVEAEMAQEALARNGNTAREARGVVRASRGALVYTVEPGRHIHLNGEPFVHIEREGSTIPADADAATHAIADALNQMRWEPPWASKKSRRH